MERQPEKVKEKMTPFVHMADGRQRQTHIIRQNHCRLPNWMCVYSFIGDESSMKNCSASSVRVFYVRRSCSCLFPVGKSAVAEWRRRCRSNRNPFAVRIGMEEQQTPKHQIEFVMEIDFCETRLLLKQWRYGNSFFFSLFSGGKMRVDTRKMYCAWRYSSRREEMPTAAWKLINLLSVRLFVTYSRSFARLLRIFSCLDKSTSTTTTSAHSYIFQNDNNRHRAPVPVRNVFLIVFSWFNCLCVRSDRVTPSYVITFGILLFREDRQMPNHFHFHSVPPSPFYTESLRFQFSTSAIAVAVFHSIVLCTHTHTHRVSCCCCRYYFHSVTPFHRSPPCLSAWDLCRISNSLSMLYIPFENFQVKLFVISLQLLLYECDTIYSHRHIPLCRYVPLSVPSVASPPSERRLLNIFVIACLPEYTCRDDTLNPFIFSISKTAPLLH